jgi:hypothetical protein
MEMMSLSALAATHPLSAVLATIKANSSANARALSDEQYNVIAQHLDEFPKGSVKLLGKTFGARPPKDVAVLTKLAMAFPLEMLDNARDLPVLSIHRWFWPGVVIPTQPHHLHFDLMGTYLRLQFLS